jgi:putative oxidoreductase
MTDHPKLYEPSRVEHVGRSGIYPMSGPAPAGLLPVRGQGALAHPEERQRQALQTNSLARTVALGMGRALYGGYFLYNGINHFVKRDMMKMYASSKGVTNVDAAVLGSGALLIAGGVSLLMGWQPKIGAAMIATFLSGVTPRMHNFWTIEDESARMVEFVNFSKNVALLGAAAFVAALPEPWPGRVRLTHAAST